jgi:hypothetical protein
VADIEVPKLRIIQFEIHLRCPRIPCASHRPSAVANQQNIYARKGALAAEQNNKFES